VPRDRSRRLIDRGCIVARNGSAGSVAGRDRKSKLICAPCTSIHLVALVFTFVPRREKASNIASFGSFIHRSLWTRTIWSPTCIEPTVSLRPLRAEQVRLSFRASFSYFISRRHDSEQGNTDACLKTLGAVSVVRTKRTLHFYIEKEFRVPSIPDMFLQTISRFIRFNYLGAKNCSSVFSLSTWRRLFANVCK